MRRRDVALRIELAQQPSSHQAVHVA
jgi:hypothetical protein